MRVPPPAPGTGQGSALLGRRRPTMERPGWRSMLMCVGILVLTVIAVGFMFVVTAYMVNIVRGHLHPGKGVSICPARRAPLRSVLIPSAILAGHKAHATKHAKGQAGLWSSVERTLAPHDADNRRLLR
jgi:hypothetical protein